LKKLIRDLLRSSWFQRAVGFLTAEFLRLVWRTNRFSFDPPDVYQIVEPLTPAIFVFWHGQHFLTPFIKTKEMHRAKVLISRHRDGEFNAIAAERLGIGTIRGSGDHGSAFYRKGGVGAFKEMVRALEQGYNVALTADVPKRSRIAGLGIIMLALLASEKLGSNHDQSTVRARGAGGGRNDHGSTRRQPPGHGRTACTPGGDPERGDQSCLREARPPAGDGSWLAPCR
jgi:lysophospholipid acyltransferase (LPLAT)-like uncharacterized protein